VGPVTLREIRDRVGPLGELLEQPVASWAPLVPWRGEETWANVMSIGTLAPVADRLEQRCRAMSTQILFSGHAGFPPLLGDIDKAPPLLFALGPGAAVPPRRRLAIVGTRDLDAGSLTRIREVAAEASRYSMGIVSGAARGTDENAHLGALDAEGETWAFMGSALDEIDYRQRELAAPIRENGGTLFSEYPPGFRSNLNSFTQRNRLISGSSDAVLVFRAPKGSGSLYTARAALDQRRPLLATPGDPWNEAAEGSNELLRQGVARPHLDVKDLLDAVGLAGSISPPEPSALDLSELGLLARQVLSELSKGPADFEALQSALPSAIGSGQLSAALVELEVFGAVVHKGGRRYEKR